MSEKMELILQADSRDRLMKNIGTFVVVGGSIVSIIFLVASLSQQILVTACGHGAASLRQSVRLRVAPHRAFPLRYNCAVRHFKSITRKT
jgi:hypothetical protein